MARKNGLQGAVPGAGRHKIENYDKKPLNVMVEREAKEIVAQISRMERGDFVSRAIIAYSKIDK